MVVKVTTSSQRSAAQRVLKKYRLPASGNGVVKTGDCNSYSRLKCIVPNISQKENISKLDVVLEAISYIQQLQELTSVQEIIMAGSNSEDNNNKSESSSSGGDRGGVSPTSRQC